MSLRNQSGRIANWETVLFAALALPFVLGTIYMTYRSLWFQFAVTRAEGMVVEISGRTPVLSVEYATGRGTTLVTQSAGSDLYKGIARGDRLTVFFDPQNPADARLDLFVENWLLPIITAIPAGILLLVMFVMRGGFSTNAPRRLKSNGEPVQAQFTRVRVEMDMDGPRIAGTLTLHDDGERCTLLHNGVARDPHDPQVQRELGLVNIIEALWINPKTGRRHVFESESLPDNPESQLKGRGITVYIDPKRPDRYRMELPFRQKTTSPQTPEQGFRGNV